MSTTPLPDDEPLAADPTTTTRRFRISDNETNAHGVVFPPPTCLTVIMHADGRAEQHADLDAVLDAHGDAIAWVDTTPALADDGPQE